ncbi:MAG: M15 family metallopeptidase [bacterium]|nr:M15 family metallopeptidase [bacterium]
MSSAAVIRRPTLFGLGLLMVAAALVALPPPSAHAAVGEGTASPGTSESWGCGQPSTNGSYASRVGPLANSEQLGGIRADLFGRTIGEVRDSLVWWTMPMSGGYQILMHERVIPALEQVAANLAVEQANGNYYTVKPNQTYGFSPRTIGGRYHVSLHGHGIALDINTLSNPYRGDNVLITNMPDWFVAAWTDAGFCWGGDWKTIKDPQHFSWLGPAATPGFGDLPAAYPVHTSAADFTDQVLTTQTEFDFAEGDFDYLLGDGDGDGLADVFKFVPRTNGTRLEYSQTDRKHDWCAIDRDHALDVDIDGRVVLLGDYSRVGRNDLWLLDTSGANLAVEISLKPTSFEESIELTTGIPVGADDAYLLGDHNRDGFADLYVIRRDDSATVVEVFDGSDGLATQLVSVDTGLGDTRGSHFTIGDPNLDELPDLFLVTAQGSTTSVQVLGNGYESVVANHLLDVGGPFVDVLVNDYDGDGRGDLWFLAAAGTLTVRLGNTRLSGVSPTFWHTSPNWECDPGSKPYAFNGVFRDDDDNIHEANIEFIAAAGVTLGCNPPFNDEYCPLSDVTRGEMAAFLVRTFGLTGDGGKDWFGDDEESIYQDDINRLAAAGITQGCNPPANDRYCPTDRVTRGEMAAFLVRGLGLGDTGDGDRFTDDDGSVFEDDIDRLATAGITLGCNPPANTRFCPNSMIGRDEMASFLSRTLPLVVSQ